MSITSTEHEGVVVVVPEGTVLGGPEATSLKAEFHRLIEEGKRKIVLDLSRVTLMNSTGLGILIGSYTSLRSTGGALALASPNEQVRTLLAVTRLDTVFRCYPGVREASADLR
ncbi:MAG: STAS domain-containing protein [Bacteroidota bacterium]|nr:STAS domain-containing protein [Bacteroidota bacterium]